MHANTCSRNAFGQNQGLFSTGRCGGYAGRCWCRAGTSASLAYIQCRVASGGLASAAASLGRLLGTSSVVSTAVAVTVALVGTVAEATESLPMAGTALPWISQHRAWCSGPAGEMHLS